MGASKSVAAWAFGAFSVTMTLVRLVADRVVARIGAAAYVQRAALVGAVGLLGAALAPNAAVAIAAWAVFGVGLAGCVPQFFSAAGNIDPAAAGTYLARVTGTGYLGLLAGPAVIGILTNWVSLTTAFAVPIVGCLLAGLLAPSALRKRARPRGMTHEAAAPEIMAPDWAEALAPVADQIAAMGQFLRDEIAAGRSYLPAGDHILRAFAEPMADVRVLITGQDPYPTPGHPVGLSFSVAPDVRPLPRSLVNIFTELEADLGIPRSPSGDLTPWAKQGVLLLNRVLTVRPGTPASHRGKGWEADHRAGHPRPRRTRHAAGRDAVGPRRAEPRADAGRRASHRVGAPQPAVGVARILRLQAVQPGQRAAASPRAPSRSTGGCSSRGARRATHIPLG